MVGGAQRLLSALPGCARDVSGAAPDVHTLCASTPQRSAGPPLVLILGGRAPSGARIRMPSTPSRRTRSSHERFPTLVPRLVEELDGRWSAPRRRCAPRLLREVRHGLRLQALRFQGFRLEALLLEGHQPHRPQRIAQERAQPAHLGLGAPCRHRGGGRRSGRLSRRRREEGRRHELPELPARRGEEPLALDPLAAPGRRRDGADGARGSGLRGLDLQRHGGPRAL